MKEPSFYFNLNFFRKKDELQSNSSYDIFFRFEVQNNQIDK